MMPDRGNTRIYACPACKGETPHYVKARRGDMVALVCANCSLPRLVNAEALKRHQSRWEDELRQILNNLEIRHGRDADED